MPEVHSDGVTGFICDHEDEMVRAVTSIGEIDRSACRREAERRFSAGAVGDAYERVYAQLVDEYRPVSLRRSA